MRLSGRERTLFIMACAIVLGCALYIGIVEPLAKKWDAEGVLLQEKYKKIQALNNELKQEIPLDEKYAAAMREAGASRRNDMTPQKLFSIVQTLTAPTGVRIKGVNPLPAEKHAFYDNVSIRVDLESDLPSLVLFIDAVKQKAGGLEIARVAVAPVEPGKPGLNSQIQISAAVYHEEEKAE